MLFKIQALLIAGLFGVCFQAQSQTYSTIKTGPWNDPLTWSDGIIPTGVNSTAIQVNHNVSLPSGYAVEIDGTTVNSGILLTVSSGATLTLAGAENAITVLGTGRVIVSGTMVGADGYTIGSNNTASRFLFNSGSVFEHQYTTAQGELPVALWGSGSTLLITGYTNAIGGTTQGNWNQQFHHVIFNLPNLTGDLNLNANLTVIRGNLSVLSTGTGSISLINGENLKAINILGHMLISGDSRLYLNRGGNSNSINITGNLNINLSPGVTCDLATSGSYTLNLNGNLSYNSPGAALNMITANNGVAIWKVKGNVTLAAGSFHESDGANTSRSELHFVRGASSAQTFTNNNCITENTTLHYVVGTNTGLPNTPNIVDILGESALKGNASTLTVFSNGRIRLFSTNPTGAFVTDGAGNIQVGGDITFQTGSRLVYKGTTPQVIGNGHPATLGVHLEIDNFAGVSFNDNSNGGNAGNNLVVGGNLLLTGGDLILQGQSNERILELRGFITASGNRIYASGPMADIVIYGAGNLGTLPFAPGAQTFRNLYINRSGGGVLIDNQLSLSGDLTLVQGNITCTLGFNVAGDVTLQNSGSIISLGPVSIGGSLTIPSGSSFTQEGDVTIGQDFVNNGAFTTGFNTITFNGTAAQEISGTTTNAFYNIVIENATDTVRIMSDQNLKGVLRLGENAVIDVDGTGENPAVFTLLSTGDNFIDDGSIGYIPASAVILGNITVQRYMAAEGRIYRYLSSPITTGRVSDLQAVFPITGNFSGSSTCTGCSTNASMFYYDAATSAYVPYPSADSAEPLEPGRGYSTFIRQDVAGPGPLTLNFTGVPNRGEIMLPVSYNSTTPNDSWNLVGNPYPSRVNWGFMGWLSSGIGETIAIRDNASGSFRYCGWDGAGYVDLTNGVIATGQAFWVRALDETAFLMITEDAKTLESGKFYRTESKPLSMLTVELKGGTLQDVTYLKLKEDASLGIDAFDAPKLTNDYMNFATRFASGKPMAVNAISALPCGEEIILDLSFVKNSSGRYLANPVRSYTLSFDTKGKFDAYNITLIDSYRGTSHSVGSGTSFNFTITTDPASMVQDRFRLVLEEKLPALDLELTTTAVCADQDAEIMISKTEEHVTYVLQYQGNLINEIAGGKDVKFQVPASLLQQADNEFIVYAKTLCGNSFQLNEVIVKRTPLIEAKGISGTQCGAGMVTLSADSDGLSQRYNWYESSESTVPLEGFTGNTFTTPVLSKSRQYYVAAVNELGCEGVRAAVKAEINYVEPVISESNSKLISNYTTGNQWFLNGELLTGADQHEFTPQETGEYSLQVSLNGCISFSPAQMFIVNALPENGINAGIRLYPNPVPDRLTVRVPITTGYTHAVLMGLQGEKIQDIPLHESDGYQNGEMVMKHFPKGVYFVKLSGREGVRAFKIVKE
ncbi:MAG TPA: T9SS type A sorting domain-containing protein [Ohtaekwangia sp.]|nr:T9SS type A sorting domain-containing protein [Ohtaekwangia sp.]